MNLGHYEFDSTEMNTASLKLDPRLSWLNLGLLGIILFAGAGLAFISVHGSFTMAAMTLLVLIIGLVCVREPEIGLLIMVFFIPFEEFNQVIDLGPFSIVKLLALGVMVAYLFHYLAISQDRKLVSAPQYKYILLLLSAVLISDMRAIDPEYAIDKTFKLLRMILFCFLVINIVRSRQSLHRLLWIMLIAGMISAAYGLYEYYFLPVSLEEMRVDGTYTDPLSFSYATAILLPILWYLFKHSARAVIKVILAIAGIILVSSIFLSGTRSGMIAALVGVSLIALREKRALLNIALVGMILLPTYLLLPHHVQARVGLTAETDNSAQASTERRWTYYTFGSQLFLEHPVVGLGLGGFAQEYSQSEYRYLRRPDEARRVAHNMYLEFAVGTGLLGLIPFLMIFISALIGLQRSIHLAQSKLLGDLAKTIQVSLVAFIFVGLFSSSQYDKPLWLLIGLSATVPNLIKRSVEEATSGAEL